MSNIFTAVANLFRSIAGKPTKPARTAAVILAAGSSTRMGGETPKQLIELCGKPIMIHSLLAFENADHISDIVLVTPKGQEDYYLELAQKHGISKIRAAVSGGDTRNQSALKGFEQLDEEVKYVAVHDAARCLVTPEIIDRVCTAAVKHKAATAATKCTDTVKISKNGRFIEYTENRDHVWLAQTPQVFLCDLYRAAAYVAQKTGFDPTDDNSLAENVKHRVKLVECGKNNMKITTAEDLAVAKAILDLRQEDNK